MDKIIVQNLEVFANHGVLKEENTLGQKFIICADITVDLQRAGEEDNMLKTINYGELCKDIKVFSETHTFQLLEAFAENLANYLLKKYERIKTIELEIKKPWAPIGVAVEYVSVKIKRGWHLAYIGLGSNIGDSIMYLEDAVSILEADPFCEVLKVSEWIKTKPYGYVEQDDFLNGCLALRTMYNPHKLLKVLHKIENQMKREREFKWGPRTLDLDILFYDDEIINKKELIVPHPDMQNRDFVLKPMAMIAPYKLHPIFNKRISQMLDEYLDKQKEVSE